MRKRIGVVLSCLLIVFLILTWLGCGKPAEQPSAKEEVKEQKLPEPNGNVSTTQLLKLTPPSAQVSIALPSIAEGLDKLVQVAKRFYPEDEVNKWVQSRVSEIAFFADVPEAKTLVEVAEARGFDISVPCGIYLDFSPSVESLTNILGSASSEGENAQGGENVKSIKDIDITDVTQPNWTVALGVKDREKVEESLKELVVEIPEISGNAPKEEIVKGTQVVSYGPYGYSIIAGYVFVGTTSLVKEVVSTFSEPVAIRYGTAEIPALDVPEGVILLKDWELVPMIDKIMPSILKAYPEAIVLDMKISPWNEIVASGEKDPVYICFSLLPEERLIVRSLFDASKKPKYYEVVGEAQPMGILKVLPDSTQASVFFEFASEYRDYLEKNIVPEVKESLADKKEIGQGLQYGTTFMRMFGNEIGICITGNIGDFPAIVLLVRAGKDSESNLKGFLDVVVSSEGEPEKHREVDIKKIPLPSPIPINLAMVKDLVIVSNNVDIIKGIIDLVLDNGTSNYLKSLNPPVDPEIPRYTFISLQSKLFLDVVFPLMSIFGKDLGSAQMDVEAVLREIREVRILSEKKDGLIEGQIVAYFNPRAN